MCLDRGLLCCYVIGILFVVNAFRFVFQVIWAYLLAYLLLCTVFVSLCVCVRVFFLF